MSHFEIERKFSISKAQHDQLGGKLTTQGFSFDRITNMVDTFLPTEKKQDMRRIRVESSNDETHYLLTLKTWVEIAGNRERNEEEEEISEEAASTLKESAEKSEGGKLPSFSKERIEYQKELEGRQVKVVLDTVKGLGKYDGNYMEIEIIGSSEDDVEPARKLIYQVAHELIGNASNEMSRSYMDMLYETSAKVRS